MTDKVPAVVTATAKTDPGVVSKINETLNRELADPAALRAILATTFKGLDANVAKQAMMEGMIRGFTFTDFLKKNVYAIKFGDGYLLVTSIDNNRKIGMKSGIVGTDEPIFVMTDKFTKSNIPMPEKATVTVHRMIDGYVGSFTATVYFDEYYKEGRTWSGKYSPSMWDMKPRTMLSKVAEMHALRKACPQELSQSYVEEEFDNRDQVTATRLDDAKDSAKNLNMGNLALNGNQNTNEENEDRENAARQAAAGDETQDTAEPAD